MTKIKKAQKVIKLPKLGEDSYIVNISFCVSAKDYNNPPIKSPADAANLVKAMVQGLADFPESYHIAAKLLS